MRRRIKKPYVAAAFLFFLLTLCPAFALTINAQNTTTCSGGYCETIVDLGKYLSTAQINTVKGVSLSSALPKVEGITSINYKFNGTRIIIYGTVYKDTYWTMPVSTLTIDPYWTKSSFNFDYANATTPDTVNSNTGKEGLTIKVKVAGAYLYNVSKVGTSQATYAYLVDPNLTIISSAAFVGNNASFGAVPLVNGKVYYLVADANGSSIQTPYKIAGGFPITTASNLDIINSSYDDACPNYCTDTITRIITQIVTYTNETIFYNFDLYLNDIAANLTVQEGTDFDISLVTNLTNINSTLYVNNTIYDTEIGNITNTTSLTVGLWNITAGSNNTDSVTLWVDVTAIPPATTNLSISWNVNMNDAPGVCLADNVTFQRQTNISYGSTYQTLTENFTCPYGCDANACNYPTWINNLIILIIVGVALYLIYKVV